MASQDTAVVLSSDDEEEGAATSGVPRLDWVRAEHALKELPPLSNPSSQPSASSSKRERDIHQQMHILHHELQWPHR